MIIAGIWIICECASTTGRATVLLVSKRTLFRHLLTIPSFHLRQAFAYSPNPWMLYPPAPVSIGSCLQRIQMVVFKASLIHSDITSQRTLETHQHPLQPKILLQTCQNLRAGYHHLHFRSHLGWRICHRSNLVKVRERRWQRPWAGDICGIGHRRVSRGENLLPEPGECQCI